MINLLLLCPSFRLERKVQGCIVRHGIFLGFLKKYLHKLKTSIYSHFEQEIGGILSNE